MALKYTMLYSLKYTKHNNMASIFFNAELYERVLKVNEKTIATGYLLCMGYKDTEGVRVTAPDDCQGCLCKLPGSVFLLLYRPGQGSHMA